MKRLLLPAAAALLAYFACFKPIERGARLAGYLKVGTPAETLLANLSLAYGATAVWQDEPIDPKAPRVRYPLDGGRAALERPRTPQGRPVGIKSLFVFNHGPFGSFIVHTHSVTFDKDGRIAAVRNDRLE